MDRTGLVMESPSDRPSIGTQIAPRASALRSRVSNHRDLLPGISGRSAPARRFRDLVSSYIVDLGGLDRVSEIKLGLLRRLAAATVQAELLEARMVNGEAIDITTLCTLSSTVVRIASRLGLERVPREVESLDRYIQRKYAVFKDTKDTEEADA